MVQEALSAGHPSVMAARDPAVHSPDDRGGAATRKGDAQRSGHCRPCAHKRSARVVSRAFRRAYSCSRSRTRVHCRAQARVSALRPASAASAPRTNTQRQPAHAHDGHEAEVAVRLLDERARALLFGVGRGIDLCAGVGAFQPRPRARARVVDSRRACVVHPLAQVGDSGGRRGKRDSEAEGTEI